MHYTVHVKTSARKICCVKADPTELPDGEEILLRFVLGDIGGLRLSAGGGGSARSAFES